MIPWWDCALAFSAIDSVGQLLAAAEPAWIWSRDGERVLWANPAGGAMLGATSLSALSRREWPASLRRSIESLGRTAPQAGTLARLRLGGDLAGAPLVCRCRRLRAGAERGLLFVGLDRTATSPDPHAISAFFSGREACAVILGAAGQRVAGDAGANESLSDSHAEFWIGGQSLRLHWAVPPANDSQRPSASDDAPAASTAELAPIMPEPVQFAPEPARTATQAPGPTPVANTLPLVTGMGPDDQPAASADIVRLRAAVLEAVAEQLASVKSLRRDGAKPALPHSAEPPALASYDGPPLSRPISAGRVPRELPRKPVRFLWQTDSADRFLFVSPGLTQIVGRNAEIVGERWQDAASRLQLDPSRRIERALAQRDTWSGQTAWWPIEGSNVRVPAELTALPIFGGDHSFQGYRGFGVLKPAEALMPAAYQARFGTTGTNGGAPVEQVPPYEEAIEGPRNVVPIRADLERTSDQARLTTQERNAFEEIAAALRSRVVETLPPDAAPPPAQPRSGSPQGARAPLNPARDAPRATEPIDEPKSPPGQDRMAKPPEASVEPAPLDGGRAAASNPGGDPVQAVDAPTPDGPPFGGAASRATSDSDARRLLREMTAILDTATDGVVVLEADGTIESVNASSEALFGLDGEEMRGANLAELLTPESRGAALDYLAGLRDNGVASLLNEGREVEAAVGPGRIPLFMTMGRISGAGEGRFCAVLRDITHWKRTEAELVSAKRAAEAASQQKSEFLARVSHEIRTPLNAIIGFAEIMIEERFSAMGNDRYREYLRDIRTSGEHVVSLVNDLLDISKIEAGKLDLNFVAVPLNELVRECIGLMQPQANRAHVVLRSSLSRDVPSIVADQRTLRQIVLNLLSNSVKFTGPGGQVIASSSLADSGEVLLRIRDTGEGMSDDELARALEPFRQIATATLSDRTGTGLGLPLTKALVEANRAGLAIRSARGEGTVVTITFPPTRVLSE